MHERDIMKRLFIILSTMFLVIGTPCFASNNLQQEDEELIRIMINSPTGRLTKHQLAIKQDYALYQKGDKENTLYGRLEALENKYNPPYDMIDKINYKYIIKTKDLYMYLINTPFFSNLNTLTVSPTAKHVYAGLKNVSSLRSK